MKAFIRNNSNSRSMKRAAPAQRDDISPPPVKRKIESTTTSKSVASFFKPASQQEPEKLSWRLVDNSLIIGRYEPQTMPPQTLKHPVKIAAFDLDDTVISPTGAKFARSAQSWRWWNPSVPGRLRWLYDDGYLVAIFSNQGNVSLKSDPKTLKKDTLSLTNLKDQLTIILRQLDLPVSMYGATGQDRYRKPRVGMWEELLEDYDLQAEGAIDKENSFFVGDAAGRAKTGKRKKDFASSDRELAANIGIKFQTPDEFFLNAASETYAHDFHPGEYLSKVTTPTATAMFAKKSPQELVIFCGSPGAGKSSYYWQVLQPQGYERVNQDILKSVSPPIYIPFIPAEFHERDRCLQKAREYLKAGESVAVDNTNANIETREHWVQVAQDFKIPIRLIRFTAPARLCEHNDSVRALNKNIMNPEGRQMLPGIAFRSFVQRFQEPTLAEGFQDITIVNFEFRGTPEERAIWSKFWVSKYST